jgi:rsbT co-antagonist protein RsbR
MASIATEADVGGVPDFSTMDHQGLKDFWQVYQAEYDAITEESMKALAGDPEFGPLIQSMTADVMEEQNRRARELLRRAMTDGDWEPYLADLREQGGTYARMGLSFVSWFRALSVVRPLIVRRLRAAFGDEPERLFRVVDAMDKWFDSAMGVIGNAYLNMKEQTILEQQEAIRELSTPVLTLMEGLLLLPVVGVIDSHRARQMTDQLLQAIHQHRAKVVVIDITGVAAVDSMVANHLVQAVEAAGLLGATAIVTGVSAEVAQTVVKIGVDLSKLRTVGDLQGGLVEARKLVGFKLEKIEAAASNGH